MTFFKRVFSSDFRRGLAAEAAGDYTTAARAYALAGERAKVAEMHLYAAERAPAFDARLAELRAGVRWADEHTDEGRAMRRRLARALLGHVRTTGVISDSDRAILREAAALFASADDHAGAGECHELIGDDAQAADAYQRAGEVERLEAVLARDEDRRAKEDQHRDAYSEYQLALASGARTRARTALAAAAQLTPDDRYRTLLATLDARRLVDGRVTLRAAGESTLYVGVFPLVLGREPACALPLRDPGISRRHAEVVELAGRYRLRDAGSKNGTQLAGLALAPNGEVPLDGEGELGLGDLCGIRFHAQPGLLRLDVVRGLDRGLRVVASAAPLEVAGAAELRFPSGVPTLAPTGGRRLALNGVVAGAPVELLHGDELELGDGPTRVHLTVE